jgi:hypothetical protein
MNQMKTVRHEKSRLLSLLAVFALTMTVALTLGACGKTTDSGDSYWVSGVISDSVTQSPIDSAWVALWDSEEARKLYSDSAGRYAIEVPVMSAKIFAGKVGYQTKQVTFRMLNSDRTGVNIVLAPLQRAQEMTSGPKGD